MRKIIMHLIILVVNFIFINLCFYFFSDSLSMFWLFAYLNGNISAYIYDYRRLTNDIQYKPT